MTNDAAEEASFSIYEKTLADELIPAAGCTEPIAVAYAAAIVAERLGGFPEKAIRCEVSANIVKNVKSVVVPNTNGLRGIHAACAAGFVSAAPERRLEVLVGLTPEEVEEIGERVKTTPIDVVPTEEPDIFFIKVSAERAGRTASATIRTSHTHVTRIEENGRTVFENDDVPHAAPPASALWSIPAVIEAARTMPIENVKPLLLKQLAALEDIVRDGSANPCGAHLSKAFLARGLDSPGSGVRLPSLARAAVMAASEARMNGCEKPVWILSGSGNQGITAGVPVMIYAKAYAPSDSPEDEDKRLRALLLADLVTLCVKQGVGKLSAYCGTVCAGSGAAAGMAMLEGMNEAQIESVISNTLAIGSGMICDGAKSSCGAKAGISVECALMALDMAREGTSFRSGDGIVQSTVDGTVRAVGRLASKGMVSTDKEIINIMLDR